MAENYVITADSEPDYDDWGIDDYWSCADWQKWYGLLKQKYGEKEAKYKWGNAWNKQTMGASPLDCRSFNQSFRDFLKKEKLVEIANGNIAFLVAPIGAVSDIVTGVSESATNVVDTAEGATKGAATTGKTLKYLLPIALIGATIIIGIVAYQKIKNVTS